MQEKEADAQTQLVAGSLQPVVDDALTEEVAAVIWAAAADYAGRYPDEQGFEQVDDARRGVMLLRAAEVLALVLRRVAPAHERQAPAVEAEVSKTVALSPEQIPVVAREFMRTLGVLTDAQLIALRAQALDRMRCANCVLSIVEHDPVTLACRGGDPDRHRFEPQPAHQSPRPRAP